MRDEQIQFLRQNEVLYRLWAVRTQLEMASPEAQKNGLPGLMSNWTIDVDDMEAIRILHKELGKILKKIR